MVDYDYSKIHPNDRRELTRLAQHVLSTEHGTLHTFVSSEHLLKEKVSGAFVECGVAYGGQIAVMNYAMKKHKEIRDIYLLDSFKGIPLCSSKDGSQPGIGIPRHNVHLPLKERLVSSGQSVCSSSHVKERLVKEGCSMNRLHFVEGWFQVTLPKFESPEIALLRLDGDLYESTCICLKYLYPRVVKGGLVIIDDYALGGCQKAVHDYLKNKNVNADIQIKTDYQCAHWFKDTDAEEVNLTSAENSSNTCETCEL